MLTQLKLRNFKSWRDTGDLALRPITGLFGANSSGKTSLLQALLLLKQTSDSPDRGLVFHFGGHGTQVDLGNFHSVVYGHNTNEEIETSLSWSVDRSFSVVNTRNSEKVLSSEHLGFTVVASQSTSTRAPRLAVKEMCYRVGEGGFGMRRRVAQGGRRQKGDYELFSRDTEFQFTRSPGRVWLLPTPFKCYGFPDEVRAHFQNAGFLADLELAFEECLQNVFYLGPLRAYPQRQYTWAGEQPIDMGETGQSVVEALLAAEERNQTISPGYKRRRLPLQTYIARWLQQLGLVHEFRVSSISEGSQMFQVKVRKTPASKEVLITDVGFGVSQILPVLVLCFYVPEGSTVILEQPEIHLHPAVQSGLADVLIDAWQKRKVQILLESHSEHLLRRLQRRVAEERINKEDIGLFFCSADTGGSTITELELDMFGHIMNWPPDFFGDEFGEIAAITEATQKRHLKATG